MDMRHASSALPYVNLFITDRYMKQIIRGLNIDDEYQTSVCYVGDSDQIEKFFNSL